MSELTKEVNRFFGYESKRKIDGLTQELNLHGELLQIYEMRYLQGKDVNFIADMLSCSPAKVHKKLGVIRAKINKILKIEA